MAVASGGGAQNAASWVGSDRYQKFPGDTGAVGHSMQALRKAAVESQYGRGERRWGPECCELGGI